MLALFGTALGLLLASWLVTLVPSLMPPVGVPIGPDARLDGRVLAVTTAFSMLMVLLIGIVPFLWVWKQDLVTNLKGEDGSKCAGRPRFPISRVLVVGQIALTVVLLVAAGLLLRSFLHSREIPLGFDTQKNLLLARRVQKHERHRTLDAQRRSWRSRRRTDGGPNRQEASA